MYSFYDLNRGCLGNHHFTRVRRVRDTSGRYGEGIFYACTSELSLDPCHAVIFNIVTGEFVDKSNMVFDWKSPFKVTV